jgi:hypothetical protein
MSYVLNIMNMIPPNGVGEHSLGSIPEISDSMKSRLRPAVRDPDNGRIYVGKRGESHDDLTQRHLSKHIGNTDYYDNHFGFYDPATKKFHVASNLDLDSTHLMSKGQRFRKYGSESVNENLWMYLPYFNRLKPGDNVQLRDGTAGTIIEVSPDRHTIQVALNGGEKVTCTKKEVVRVAQ